MKGWAARSEKGFLESTPVSAGALAEENLRLRARPGSRSLLGVEVHGRVSSAYLLGESPRREVGMTCPVWSGPRAGGELGCGKGAVSCILCSWYLVGCPALPGGLFLATVPFGYIKAWSLRPLLPLCNRGSMGSCHIGGIPVT